MFVSLSKATVTVGLPNLVPILVRIRQAFLLCMHWGLEPATLYGVFALASEFFCV